jgi:uncharacterized protein (TIGR00255 family)
MTALLASMTGFARSEGAVDGFVWAWELRSVNGRGLELRTRLPSGFDALEAGLREIAGKQLRRGNVTANLTVRREEKGRLAVDQATLDEVLAIALALADNIPGAAPPRAEALLALPGVLRQAVATETEESGRAQADAVRRGFLAALDDLVTSRRGEGGRLAVILAAQLDDIAALRDQAAQEAADQPAAQRARMLENLQRRGSRKRSPCWPRDPTCGRSSTGWRAISKPPVRCSPRAPMSAVGSISWSRSSIARPIRCAASPPRCRSPRPG